MSFHFLSIPFTQRTLPPDCLRRSAGRLPPRLPLLPDGAAKVATLFESANLSVFFFFIFFPGPCRPGLSKTPFAPEAGAKVVNLFPFPNPGATFFFKLPAALPAAGTLRSRLFPEAVPEGAAKVRRIFYPANLCVFFSLFFFPGPADPACSFPPLSGSGCKGSEPFPFFQTRGQLFFKLPAALPATGPSIQGSFQRPSPKGLQR